MRDLRWRTPTARLGVTIARRLGGLLAFLILLVGFWLFPAQAGRLVTDSAGLLEMQHAVEQVEVDRSVGEYCVALVSASRSHRDVLVGTVAAGLAGAAVPLGNIARVIVYTTVPNCTVVAPTRAGTMTVPPTSARSIPPSGTSLTAATGTIPSAGAAAWRVGWRSSVVRRCRPTATPCS